MIMTPLECAALALFPAQPSADEEPAAVWSALPPEVRQHLLAQARAVLQAIREPSAEMLEAGGMDERWDGVSPSSPEDEEVAAAIWKTMIDAALEEG